MQPSVEEDDIEMDDDVECDFPGDQTLSSNSNIGAELISEAQAENLAARFVALHVDVGDNVCDWCRRKKLSFLSGTDQVSGVAVTCKGLARTQASPTIPSLHLLLDSE